MEYLFGYTSDNIAIRKFIDMHYQVVPNPKNESDRKTAFLEQIRAHDPSWIVVGVGPEDMIDPDAGVILGNFHINGYELKLVDMVRYSDGRVLYSSSDPVNNERPKKDEVVAEAGRPD